MLRAWRSIAGSIMLLLIAWAPPVSARPAHKRALADYFGPLLASKLNDCRTCHVPDPPGAPTDQLASEKPHNAFGARLKAVRGELRKAGKKTDIPTRLQAIFNEDSDGDGVSNLIELLTGHFPGDPNDKPTAAELAEAPKLLAAFEQARRAYRWTPFETVKRPPVPVARNRQWVQNPIDAFVAAEREAHSLKPRPQASKPTLLRRVYLDLIGIPPTREQLHAFLGDDSPDAYEKVVEGLLASPRYGERWGRHWMDVWRYSDWAGFGEEVRESQKHIWHWRDWIIESLNQDKGYDRMLQEMLAGDELAPEDPATLRATGFLVRNWYKFNRQVWLDHAVEHTSKAFLGVTVNCARCHDHMYDPILQKEYYAFRAFFQPHQVRTDRLPGQPDVSKDGIARVYDGDLTAPTYLFVRGNDANPDKSKALTPDVPAVFAADIEVQAVNLPKLAYLPDKRPFVIDENVQTSESAIIRMKALLAAAQRSLAAARPKLAVAGKSTGKVAEAEQVVRSADDELRLAQLNLAVAEAGHVELLALLIVEHLEDAGAQKNDPDTWRQAALDACAAQQKHALLEARRNHVSAQRALSRLQAATNTASKPVAQKAAADLPKVQMQLTAAAAALAKAETEAKKPLSTAYTRRVVANYPATSTGRRLALARWITDRKNPLTARAAMNHIWLRHFGKAIVPTVFDFGRNGRPPSHPALLDWLADEFMRNNWSMKAMHRLIVLSSTYRMDSTPDPATLAIDPDNRYLWRMSPRRLEAESVRDSVLAVAGDLDTSMGGPDIDYRQGLTVPRRSVYFRHAAEKQMEFLEVFDAANVTECYQRSESIVPQQALALFNSSLVTVESRRLAERICSEAGCTSSGEGDAAFVRIAFEQVLGRLPTGEEQDACCRFLTEQAALLHNPKNLTRFTAGAAAPVAGSGDANLRAREDLIQVLMNHHDFVTIR